jgi:ribosomal protein S18 acetylase RimI-like enzyme
VRKPIMQSYESFSRGVTFEWPEHFSHRDRDECVLLLNTVASMDGTNGYSRELTVEDGHRLFTGLEFAISRREASQLLVRDEKSRIVGIATLQRYKQPDRHHAVEISRVAIAPEHRGKFLMKGWREVLHQVEEIGGDLIVIDVSEDGPVRLWERLGFKTWGVMKDYARVDSRQLNGYFMAVYVRNAWVALGTKQPLPA